ncbi:trypsin-like serine protease [Ramicandelaber brevisporus]|nr:trypsin-like serine protease [Ramicandelaber brevisporus]
MRVSITSIAVLAAASTAVLAAPGLEPLLPLDGSSSSGDSGTGFGNGANNDNVIGGTVAASNEAPFAALIFSNGWNSCGGSIIGSQWILTAAHCLSSANPGANGPGQFTTTPAGQLTVMVGRNTNSASSAVRVERVIPHSQYDPSNMHQDIGLLKLSAPLTLNSNTKQVPIFSGSISAGNKFTIAGWGRTDNNGNLGASNLMKATLTIGDTATCQKGASEYTDSNGQFICTIPQNNEGTCYGDSGGPLLAGGAGSYSLAGLVSFEVNYKEPQSKACAVDGTIGFYTRASQYLGWISSNTGISQADLLAGRGNPSPSDGGDKPNPTPSKPATPSTSSSAGSPATSSNGSSPSKTSSDSQSAKPTSSTSGDSGNGSSKPNSDGSSDVNGGSGGSGGSDSGSNGGSDNSNNSGSGSGSGSNSGSGSGDSKKSGGSKGNEKQGTNGAAALTASLAFVPILFALF